MPILDTTATDDKQTVLIWDLRDNPHDSMRYILSMAGYKVRFVFDEADAINMVDIMKTTGSGKVACLFVRCAQNMSQFAERFRLLEQANFAAPIVLHFSADQRRTAEEFRKLLPQSLNLHLCFSDNTLNAMADIIGLTEKERAHV